MGRKSRRSGGRAQLGTRQSLGRAMRNKQLGAKSRRQQQLQQEQPWWSRAREPRFPTRAMQLTTIRSRDWEFINEINVRGVLIFLAIGNPTGRGGGHALLPVEDFLGPPIYSVPQAFRGPLICRQQSARFRAFSPSRISFRRRSRRFRLPVVRSSHAAKSCRRAGRPDPNHEAAASAA